MSTVHRLLPHRDRAGRMSEEVHARTIVVGLAALLALVALLGALAGAATWGIVRLITNAMS